MLFLSEIESGFIQNQKITKLKHQITKTYKYLPASGRAVQTFRLPILAVIHLIFIAQNFVSFGNWCC